MCKPSITIYGPAGGLASGSDPDAPAAAVAAAAIAAVCLSTCSFKSGDAKSAALHAAMPSVGRSASTARSSEVEMTMEGACINIGKRK